MDTYVAHVVPQAFPFWYAAGEFGQAVHEHHNTQTCAHYKQAKVSIVAEL
jgi:hypothetical protein